MSLPPRPTLPEVYVLPGEAVFPEGITEGPDGTFFVGSTTDGTIFRILPDEPVAEVWLPGGADGRTELLGLTVDARRRLVSCGMGTGHVFVHDLADRSLVARRTVPSEPALLNDVAADSHAAYVTDSARPVVWRLPLDVDGSGAVGDAEPLVDLAPLGAPDDSFLNGIVVDEARGLVLAVAQAYGVLWRIDTATGAATRVDLGGATLGADGLLLRTGADGETLLLGLTHQGETREDVTFWLSVVRLDADWRTGELVREVALPEAEGFDVPTTLAAHGDRVLVVCAQVLHQDDPRPPFLVKALDLPDVRG